MSRLNQNYIAHRVRIRHLTEKKPEVYGALKSALKYLELPGAEEAEKKYREKTPLWENENLKIILKSEVYETLEKEIDLSQEERLERGGTLLGRYIEKEDKIIFEKVETIPELEKKLGIKIKRKESSVQAPFGKYLEGKKRNYSAVGSFHTHPGERSVPSATDISNLPEKCLNSIGVVVAKNGKVEMSGYTPYSIFGICGDGKVDIGGSGDLLKVYKESGELLTPEIQENLAGPLR